MRRPSQVGPTAYRAEPRATGWVVIAEWSEIDRNGDRDDGHEEVVRRGLNATIARQVVADLMAQPPLTR